MLLRNGDSFLEWQDGEGKAVCSEEMNCDGRTVVSQGLARLWLCACCSWVGDSC